jgi:hypothetical protein
LFEFEAIWAYADFTLKGASMKIKCFFVDDERKKSIPYPQEIRADSINAGFFDLKSRPDLVTKIMEASDLPSLLSLVQFFSEKASPYFSIGCEKAVWMEENGRYAARGYVEFSFNYRELAHRQNYQSMHENFKASVGKAKIRGLSSFEWRVSTVSIDSAGIILESCTIWTKVVDQGTVELAFKRYDQSMRFLESYFREIAAPHGSEKPIFG